MQKQQPHLIPWDCDVTFHRLLENILSAWSQSYQTFALSLTQTSAEVRMLRLRVPEAAKKKQKVQCPRSRYIILSTGFFFNVLWSFFSGCNVTFFFSFFCVCVEYLLKHC